MATLLSQPDGKWPTGPGQSGDGKPSGSANGPSVDPVGVGFRHLLNSDPQFARLLEALPALQASTLALIGLAQQTAGSGGLRAFSLMVCHARHMPGSLGLINGYHRRGGSREPARR